MKEQCDWWRRKLREVEWWVLIMLITFQVFIEPGIMTIFVPWPGVVNEIIPNHGPLLLQSYTCSHQMCKETKSATEIADISNKKNFAVKYWSKDGGKDTRWASIIFSSQEKDPQIKNSFYLLPKLSLEIWMAQKVSKASLLPIGQKFINQFFWLNAKLL